jgi:hypothetical protein
MARPREFKVVLDAQQLERIFAVAVDQIILQFAQAGDLARDVCRVSDNGGEGDDQA